MRHAAVALLVVGLVAIKACDVRDGAEGAERSATAKAKAACGGAGAASAAATRNCGASAAPRAGEPASGAGIPAPVSPAALRRWEAEASAGAARLALGGRKSLPLTVSVAPLCSAGFLDRAADALAGDEGGVLVEVRALACEGRTTLARAFLPRDIKAHPLKVSVPVAASAKTCVVRISLCAVKGKRGDATCAASDAVAASRVAWLDGASFVLLEDRAAYRSSETLASALGPLLGKNLAHDVAAATPRTSHNLSASLSSAGVALTIDAFHPGDCRPRTKGKP